MPVKQSPEEAAMWKKWMDSGDVQTANQLLEHYMYLVQFHVERTASHLPSNVVKDDLKSYGMMGLYDAIKKFDPDRDLKFDTYASFRVRGAIIDGLRKEDWLPRSIREKGKKVENASRILEQTLQREPTSHEIASYLGISSEEVESIVKDSLFSNVLSIDENPKEGTERSKDSVGYDIKDNEALTPDEELIDSEMKVDLVQGIKSLTENEQLIISLFLP
ncbi:sigma-70 family RNA polymerase sigma factor [Virgibacillus halophilus]|uniref:Sigma-70 family RNA polymerase sigma factor n=1 Tax=Tigheibacillus halophilus TaxID=361280 RepID=A0ABU5CB00_9BACI|nr:sigma-70 family RNA polymerase sigma factor [Virgibacillus halophilus]